jgi:beta-exotoxin I transport system ATP-binding protein
MTPAIEAERLTKRYGARTGVDSIDLGVPEGALFGFLGPNGAGKTTLIRLLMGFLRPTAGRARVGGRECWTHSHEIKRDVGYLPGDLRLYPWMTVRSAIALAGRARRQRLARAGERLAERFRLDPTVPVRRMSRGMRQKVGIILALAHQPRVLVLDEPTTGLDPLMQDELTGALREMSGAGSTVFFSSHTLSEVESLCSQIAIVREGRIVADEPLDALRARALRQVVIRFSPGATPNADPPASLHVEDRTGLVWRCRLEGEAGPIVRWLAPQPVEDVSISQPDLEEVFRRLYRDDAETDS